LGGLAKDLVPTEKKWLNPFAVEPSKQGEKRNLASPYPIVAGM
jgi:hypothetical protein